MRSFWVEYKSLKSTLDLCRTKNLNVVTKGRSLTNNLRSELPDASSEILHSLFKNIRHEIISIKDVYLEPTYASHTML